MCMRSAAGERGDCIAVCVPLSLRMEGGDQAQASRQVGSGGSPSAGRPRSCLPFGIAAKSGCGPIAAWLGEAEGTPGGPRSRKAVDARHMCARRCFMQQRGCNRSYRALEPCCTDFRTKAARGEGMGVLAAERGDEAHTARPVHTIAQSRRGAKLLRRFCVAMPVSNNELILTILYYHSYCAKYV